MEIFGGDPDPSAESGESLNALGSVLLVVGILCLMGGLLAILEWDKWRRLLKGDRRQRIRELTEALRDAMDAIDLIRAETEEGHRILEKLEADVAATQHVAQLTKAEAAGVQHLLEDALRKERTPSLIRDSVLMLVGAVIGAVAGRVLLT